MERLYFECPQTGRKVDVGIESEVGTLLRIRGETVSAACPHCGGTHVWKVGEAHLDRPTADALAAGPEVPMRRG